MKNKLIITLCYIFISSSNLKPTYQLSQDNQVPAFPGAEGFGKYTTGGRRGMVYIVTNLQDSGLGSFRWALESLGPRTVVFEISGTINLKSPIRVKDGDLTIAGQSAPGDGITIKNYPVRIYNSDNIVIRFLRFRLGDLAGKEYDSFTFRYGDNLIIDHCSFSWGTDETLSVYDIKKSTIQNSLISEGLNDSVHEKGQHGYGGLWGGENVSFYKNLITHFAIRLPSITDKSEIFDFRSNVIFNWSYRATNNGSGAKANLINNFYKPGPASLANKEKEVASHFLFPTSKDKDPQTYGKFFLEGNILEGKSEIYYNQWLGVRLENTSNTKQYLEFCKNKDDSGNNIPFEIPTGLYSKNLSAIESYEYVLSNVGSSLVRDVVDKRIINEVKTGSYTFKGSKTGLFGIIDSQDDVGGWPELKSLPAPKDTDRDGMPDDWEISNGLDPNRRDDRFYDLHPHYTNLEVYLNSLVEHIIK